MTAVFKLHHSEGPHRFLKRKSALRLFRKAGLGIVKERTTVIIPVGSRWLTRFGERLERFVGEGIRRMIALRRIFILRK